MTTDAKPGPTVPLADISAAFSAADQTEIRAHADHLIQESRTVARLRRDMGTTQAELAEALVAEEACACEDAVEGAVERPAWHPAWRPVGRPL